MKLHYSPLFSAIALFFTLACSLCRADEPKVVDCKDAVASANTVFKQQNDGIGLEKEGELVTLLKMLNQHNALPNEFVTTEAAKKAGWDGKGSLWDVWLLNKKVIGGDPYVDSWLTADLESFKGNRSNKRLVYRLDSRTRYLTNAQYENMAEIAPCR